MESLKTKSGTWHHVYRPTKDHIKWLKDHFHLHDLVLAELSKPTMRPKTQRFDHYLYLVLHFPIFNEKTRKTHPAEIDFIVTKKDVVTVTFEPIQPLEEFFRVCATDKSCEDLYLSKTTIHLLYHLIQHLYEFSLRELDHVQEKIALIEDEIFAGREREVVEEITMVGRDIIDFRRSLKPQEVTLQSLAAQTAHLFGAESQPFMEGLLGEYQKVWHLLENHKETLEALYETNTTLLNIKQNDIMKVLTMMAFITFPLTLFATVLAINTRSNPIVGKPFDFWIISGLIIGGAVLILWVFKKRRWI